MSAMKIAEPAHLRRRLDRTANNAFKSASGLHFQRIEQSMCSLTNRNNNYIAVGIEIVEILAHAQHPAFTIHISLECFINAGFRESMLKELPCHNTHLNGYTLAVCSGRHGGGL